MVAGLVPVNLAVQALSFASSIALAVILGASASTDAYYLGLSIPVLVSGILLAGVRLGAIPLLTERRVEGVERFVEGCRELISAVLCASIVLSAAATGITILALPLIIGRASETVVPLAQVTVLELAPLGVSGAIIGALGAILAVRGRFVPTVAVMGFEPLIKTVLVITLGRSLGVHALVIGNVVGSLLAALCLWRLVVADGVSLRLTRPTNSGFVKRVLTFSGPLLIGQSILQANPIVDRTMASTLGPGSVTVLELGLRMFGVPLALLGSTLIGPVTATWAARKTEGGWPALRSSVTGALTKISIVAPPLVVLGVFLADESATLMYVGGAYSLREIDATGSVLKMLILGLPAQLFMLAFAVLFVVQGDTRFLMCLGVANVALNVGLNLVLRSVFGLSGIALSTTLTLTLLTALAATVAHRRWGVVGSRSMGQRIPRLAVASLLATVTAYAIGALLGDSPTRAGALLSIVAVTGGVVAAYSVSMLVGDRRHLQGVIPARRHAGGADRG